MSVSLYFVEQSSSVLALTQNRLTQKSSVIPLGHFVDTSADTLGALDYSPFDGGLNGWDDSEVSYLKFETGKVGKCILCKSSSNYTLTKTLQRCISFSFWCEEEGKTYARAMVQYPSIEREVGFYDNKCVVNRLHNGYTYPIGSIDIDEVTDWTLLSFAINGSEVSFYYNDTFLGIIDMEVVPNCSADIALNIYYTKFDNVRVFDKAIDIDLVKEMYMGGKFVLGTHQISTIKPFNNIKFEQRSTILPLNNIRFEQNSRLDSRGVFICYQSSTVELRSIHSNMLTQSSTIQIDERWKNVVKGL